MYALYDDQRRNLIRFAAMLVLGGLAVVPLTFPPSSLRAKAQGAARAIQTPVPAVPEALQFPAIAVTRDPFVPGARTVSARSLPAAPVIGVRQGQDIGIVLPANAGAQEPSTRLGPENPAPARVRGVVLGNRPEALIDTGRGVAVFAVGDAVGTDVISAIDAGGVTFASGVRVKIASVIP